MKELKPLWIYQFPKLGYSISITPNSKRDEAKMKRKAKRRKESLAEYCHGEIITAMVIATKELGFTNSQIQ